MLVHLCKLLIPLLQGVWVQRTIILPENVKGYEGVEFNDKKANEVLQLYFVTIVDIKSKTAIQKIDIFWFGSIFKMCTTIQVLQFSFKSHSNLISRINILILISILLYNYNLKSSINQDNNTLQTRACKAHFES